MRLGGWKAIADAIGAVWGRSVSVRAAQRYAANDGLPVRRQRRRVVGESKDVADWAERQIQPRVAS
jgi:hypothetical protein